MGKRVPASVQTDQQIRELLSNGSAAGGGGGDVRSELIRLGVRRIIEEALEREVDEFLGPPASTSVKEAGSGRGATATAIAPGTSTALKERSPSPCRRSRTRRSRSSPRSAGT